MVNPKSFSMANSQPQIWTKWHARLHKKLLSNKELLPKGASLLVAVSGGQDSMAMLQLLLDLQGLHKWKLYVWHGDHGWHSKSGIISQELQSWCKKNHLKVLINQSTKKKINSEEAARNWRYEQLILTAKILSSQGESSPCNYVLTGHTSSDKAETLLQNLARGTDLAGLSSLPESRKLLENIQLIRPLLIFNRQETAQICQDMSLPVWLDPSNKNTHLSRNRIRYQVLPVLEDLYPGCSSRMASLAERLSYYKKDQQSMAHLLLNYFQVKSNLILCRESLSGLPLTARATILANWLKQNGVPSLTANQLEALSQKIGKRMPPGQLNLKQNWKITWIRELIKLEHPSFNNSKNSH